MVDTVFRSKIETPKEVLPEGKEPTRSAETNVEVPYLDYERTSGHPFSVDYFKLGDSWNDPVGGFPKEISQIEEYVQEKINSGETANSISAIKNLLKNMEKLTNVSKEERAVIKIETLASYVEFLRKTDNLRSNLKRYANT